MVWPKGMKKSEKTGIWVQSINAIIGKVKAERRDKYLEGFELNKKRYCMKK